MEEGLDLKCEGGERTGPLVWRWIECWILNVEVEGGRILSVEVDRGLDIECKCGKRANVECRGGNKVRSFMWRWKEGGS